MTALFPPTIARPHWRVLRWVWTPADTLEVRAHRDRATYQQWADAGYLIPVPGTRVNHDVIREALVGLRELATIEAIGFDPWHADQLEITLAEKDGFEADRILEVSQTYAGMSSGCKELEAEVLAANVDASDVRYGVVRQ